jgi:hypothetical protein
MVVLVSFTTFAFAGGDQNQNRHDGELGEGPTNQVRIDNPNQDALEVRVLTNEQKLTIHEIYEEEKVARDVYITLEKLYPKENTFANIQLAEQTHMNAVRKLCVKYAIEIPELDQAVGVFELETIGNLYNFFVEKGEISLLDALTAGKDIENMDMDDLEAAKEGMPKDVQNVFSNLMIGSSYHLTAFFNAIARVESLND